MLSSKVAKCTWCCCAFLFIALCIQLAFLPQLIRNKVDSGIVDALIVTSNTSSGYDSWKSNTADDAVPVWMECRFFNVTNVYEVVHYGAMPKLEITPPMVYNDMSVKFNISFTADKEWQQFNTWTYYTYNKDRSYLDPKAEITIISPLIGAIYYSQAWHTGFDEKLEAIKILEKNLEYVNISDILFWRGTAEDLLFNIYHPHIPIHIYNPPILPPIWFNETIPFGLLGNGSNSSHDSYEILNTGNSDNSRMGELKYFGKFGEYVDCWKSPYPLSPGHDTYFGLNAVSKNGELAAWVDTLAINIKMDYNYSYKWQGIELYRHTVQVSPQFDTAEQYPPNAEFFQFMYSGLENLTSCSSGIPFFVSLPYFLGGDKRLIQNLTMMNLPEPSWGDYPFIDVEPTTGAIFKANKSLQINTMIHSIPWIRNHTKYSEPYKRLPDDLVVPVVELSECSSLTDSQAKSFKSAVINSRMYADVLEILGYVSCGLLVVFLMSSTFVYGKHYAGKQHMDLQVNKLNKKLLEQSS